MQGSSSSPSKTLELWTRERVASRILEGDTLVVYESTVLRIPPSWLAAHPGGALAILHFVGRDATDEVQACHTDETMQRVKAYAVGRVEVGEDGWEPFLPPVHSGWVRQDGRWMRKADERRDSSTGESGVQGLVFTEHNHSHSEVLLVEKSASNTSSVSPTLESITPPPTALKLPIQTRSARAYRDLHAQITAAGLYKTPYLTGYGPEIARYTLLAALAWYFYSKGWFVTSAIFLGLLWHQLTFTAHDLGHMGVTHSWVRDRIIAIIIADFVGGLSIGWWVDNHNIHHLVTNHPTHDPDIQHIPFFAISPAFLTSLYSSYYDRIMKFDLPTRLLLPIQHKLYYIVMSLARFNLYAQSYIFLWKRGVVQGKRNWDFWAEIAGLCVYWAWYGRVLVGTGHWRTALAYALVSHMVASPLHVQIVLSHFSRSTADLGPSESFVARQLRTTTDVICSPSIEFIHGGLHLQVTHHLFPRLPRHNLRKASLLVKEFAEKEGLKYHEFRFIDGNEEVLGVLKGVAEQVKIVGMVADAEAREMYKASCGKH